MKKEPKKKKIEYETKDWHIMTQNSSMVLYFAIITQLKMLKIGQRKEI